MAINTELRRPVWLRESVTQKFLTRAALAAEIEKLGQLVLVKGCLATASSMKALLRLKRSSGTFLPSTQYFSFAIAWANPSRSFATMSVARASGFPACSRAGI